MHLQNHPQGAKNATRWSFFSSASWTTHRRRQRDGRLVRRRRASTRPNARVPGNHPLPPVSHPSHRSSPPSVAHHSTVLGPTLALVLLCCRASLARLRSSGVIFARLAIERTRSASRCSAVFLFLPRATSPSWWREVGDAGSASPPLATAEGSSGGGAWDATDAVGAGRWTSAAPRAGAAARSSLFRARLRRSFRFRDSSLRSWSVISCRLRRDRRRSFSRCCGVASARRRALRARSRASWSGVRSLGAAEREVPRGGSMVRVPLTAGICAVGGGGGRQRSGRDGGGQFIPAIPAPAGGATRRRGNRGARATRRAGPAAEMNEATREMDGESREGGAPCGPGSVPTAGSARGRSTRPAKCVLVAVAGPWC